MSQKVMVGCRVSEEWHTEILSICEATGQTSSEVLNEAIALYLKKSKAVTVRSRLEEIDQRLSKLALLVTQ